MNSSFNKFFLAIPLFFITTCILCQYQRTYGPSEGYYFEVLNTANASYVMTPNGLYKTVINGEKFTRLELPEKFYSPHEVAIDSNEIFLTYSDYNFSPSKLVYSDDQGQSWKNLPNRPENLEWSELSYKSGVLLATSSNQKLYESRDKGETWIPIKLNPIDELKNNNKYFFVSTYPDGLLRREIHGNTWENISNTSSQFSNFLVTDHMLLEIKDKTGNFVSKDNGSTWTPSNFPIKNSSYIFTIADFVTELFVFNNEILYKSSDTGITWNKINTISRERLNLLSVQRLGSQLVGFLYYMGLVKTEDNFDHWMPASNGIDAATISTLESRDSTLFAVSWNNIYQYNTKSSEWTSIGEFNNNYGREVFICDDASFVWENFPDSKIKKYDLNNQLVSVDSSLFSSSSSSGGIYYWYHNNEKYILKGRAGLISSIDNGLNWKKEIPNLSRSGIKDYFCMTTFRDSLLILGLNKNNKLIMSITKDLENWFPFGKEMTVNSSISNYSNLVASQNSIILLSNEHSFNYDFNSMNFVRAKGLKDNYPSLLQVNRMIDLDSEKLLLRNLVGNFISNDKGYNWHKIIDNFYSYDRNNHISDICMIDSIIYIGTNGSSVLMQDYKDYNGIDNTIDVFYDMNNNDIRDQSEKGIESNLLVLKNKGHHLYTDKEGYSNFYLLPNISDTVEVINKFKYGTYTPSSRILESKNSKYSFAYKISNGIHDVSLDIVSYNAARPGFNYTIQLILKNHGSEIWNGELNLQYEKFFEYLNSSESPFSNSNLNLNYKIGDLQPFSQKIIQVIFLVNSNTNIGTEFTFNGLALNQQILDQDITDNNASLKSKIVASYDPNNILVNKEIISKNEYFEGSELEYTVQFQNTGNHPAEFVRIKIQIDDFRKESLHFLSSSHPFEIVPSNNSNFIELEFNNINLSDSLSNELKSHGFVRFKVLINNEYEYRTHIFARAFIYFDYNEPIQTNSAITKIINTTNIQVNESNINNNFIYPNPTTGDLFIKQKNSSIVTKIEVLNVFGQNVLKLNTPSWQNQEVSYFNIEELIPGTYLLKLLYKDGSVSLHKVIHQ